MKKTFMLMLMAGASLSANIASAGDGTINFTGNIISDACTVSTGDADQTVALGDVSTTAFSAAGDKASPTTFKIDLSACPSTVTKVTVKFDGVSDSKNSALLALDADQTATGVGIEIADAQGNAIPLHSASAQYTVNTTTKAATLNFLGRYVATAATVGAGTANGTSQFTINYQ
jgi:major type 1 subunit fimbrin (pilin)